MSVSGKDPKVRAGAVDVVRYILSHTHLLVRLILGPMVNMIMVLIRHWQELGYLIIYITARPDMQQQKVVSWLSQHNFPHGLVSFADGLSTDPLGHKAAYLHKLIQVISYLKSIFEWFDIVRNDIKTILFSIQEHGVIIHYAYGSSKDISVYTAINLKQNQIFIIGKVSKKYHSLATILHDGYAAHLSMLQAHGGSRPAQGNARMVIPRGQFGLPGQNASLRRRR